MECRSNDRSPGALGGTAAAIRSLAKACHRGQLLSAEDAPDRKQGREAGRHPRPGRATAARGRLRGAVGGGDRARAGSRAERDLLVLPLQGPPVRRGAGADAARDRGAQAVAQGRGGGAHPVVHRPVRGAVQPARGDDRARAQLKSGR